MTVTNNQREGEPAIDAERSAAALRAILAQADPATWYPQAPKARSAWEPFDLCDLRGSDLSNQQIGAVMMAECALDGANFSHAVLLETSLQSTSVSRANFTNAKLRRTQMIPFFGEHTDFSRATFDKAAMEYARLLDCNFRSAQFAETSLSHADLSRSAFSGAQFSACQLDSTLLHDADLREASFTECDLRKAVFQSAQMKGTALVGCEMVGTDFRHADVEHAVIRGGHFGIYEQGSVLTPTRFDDTPAARRLVAASGAEGIDSIEWSLPDPDRATTPRSVPAGQPCPRNGFWFTPVSLGSRRYFKQGDVMPALDGDYGATVWQWDRNQNPPKL